MIWVALCIWLFGTAWYSLPSYSVHSKPKEIGLILTREEYDTRIDTHDRPYVYEIPTLKQGGVLVFGAEHTMQPCDEQIGVIRTRWKTFQPTIALVESDLGIMFPTFMDPVETFGEPGLVYALALKQGIPTFSWEPPDEVIIKSALEQGFTPEQVALRWVLSPYFSNLRHGQPDDPEGFVLDTLRQKSAVPGIKGILDSMKKINDAWYREFPNGPDWRVVSDQYGLPGFLGTMDLNHARDIYLVACISDLVNAGERVFVICGSSHAVVIEPALRAMFNTQEQP